MSTELELTARLDALGRSLASSAPMEPPAVFMQGVRHQHKITMIKKSVLAALAAALVIAVVLVASRQHSTPAEKGEKPPVPRKLELPAVGAMRSLVNSPDDIDDAPLLPPKEADDGGDVPLRVKEWRKELAD